MTGDGATDVHVCQTKGCGKEAKMRCPQCIKLDIQDGTQWFCDQTCFKKYWPEHKVVHMMKECSISPPDVYPNYKYTGTLRKYPISPFRKVPQSIPRPDYVHHPQGVSLGERDAKHENNIKVLTEDELDSMRVVCKLARQVMDTAAQAVEPGITTDELDKIVHETAVELECYPSPLGYRLFPKSVCTSVNEVICHGIPDLRPLENGDICNIDVTVYHRGFHGDLNETYLVGDKVDDESIRLIEGTHKCIMAGIDTVRPGVKYREIGNAIEKQAKKDNLSVVRTYCGHGIHRLFHTAPNVPHYAKSRATGVMTKNHCFTIEPMINLGDWRDTHWPDDWTAVTTDGKRSAQFEQTMVVTDDGVDVLTKRPTENGRPWFIDQLIAHNYAQAKKYTENAQ